MDGWIDRWSDICCSDHVLYRHGLPLQDSIAALQSGRISPIVMERLDESLVVAAAHLGWSLADMVVVMPRKVPCVCLL